MHGTLIDNQWRAGEGEPLQSTTPDGKQILWQGASSSTQQVLNAVQSAQKAGDEWRALGLSERIRIVQRFADKLDQQKRELATAITLETGKPNWEAQAEVGAMVNKVAISIRAQAERAGSRHNKHLSLSHHGHGVMAVFGPYNFPGHLPNGHIVPALLAGNTIVFKPSELTAHVGELTAQLWLEAGLPEGVLNLVQGGGEVGRAIINADINGVLFTGSYNTGREIHRQLAGRPEVLLALEMGGNNPMIVGQINDTEVAASTILHSAFLSAGQRCTCTRRLILTPDAEPEKLLESLVAMCERIILHPDHPTPFMGPVINDHTARRLLSTQDELLNKGAIAVRKMVADAAGEVYLTPGILDVTAVADHQDEELFGPLLQVVQADSFDEAISLANATRYGLAAGLLSDNSNEQKHFKAAIKAGIISINLPTAGASSELPFGGIGASGNHRPSAYYAADYCAWPQALSTGQPTDVQAEKLNIDQIRGLR